MPRQAALWTSKASQRRARTRLGGRAGSAARKPGTWACSVAEGGALRAAKSGCAVARGARRGSEEAAEVARWREGGAACAPTKFGRRSAGVGRALPALWLEADGPTRDVGASAGASAPAACLARAWGRPSACAAWCRSLLIAAREVALGPRVEAGMAKPFAKRRCGTGPCRAASPTTVRPLGVPQVELAAKGAETRPSCLRGCADVPEVCFHDHVFAAVGISALAVLPLAQPGVVAQGRTHAFVRIWGAVMRHVRSR